MPKLLIFDAFTLLIHEKTVANYALLQCKTFSLKIWVCKIFDKFHVWQRDPLNPNLSNPAKKGVLFLGSLPQGILLVALIPDTSCRVYSVDSLNS